MGLTNSKSQLDESWLNDWTLVEFLGSGSYGGVYKAENKATEEISAVKVTYLQKHLLENMSDFEKAKTVSRMRREFLLLQGKRHKNIVNVYEEFETQLDLNAVESILKNVSNSSNRLARHAKNKLEFWASGDNGVDALFIRMELCGMNLRQWIDSCGDSEWPLWVAQINIISNILEGLAFLHENRILHRDLKSENIFFALGSTPYHVKIGDFGISRVIHSEECQSRASSQTLNPTTTPLYKAPELDNEENYTLQADLYSLGLLILEILKMLPSKERGLTFSKVKDRDVNLALPTKPFINAQKVVEKLTICDTKNRLETVQKVNLKVVPELSTRLPELTSQLKVWDVRTVVLKKREYLLTEFSIIVASAIQIIGDLEGGSVVTGRYELTFDDRVIKNIEFRSRVNITGNNNTLCNVTFGSDTDDDWLSLQVSGRDNVINDSVFKCPAESVRLIWLEGDRNTVSNVNFKDNHAFISINVRSGNSHIVKDIRHCLFMISFYDGTSSCTLDNVKCGSNNYLGGSNHSFSHVECTALSLYGEGHKFYKCKGRVRKSTDLDYDFVNCTFEIYDR